MLRASNLKIVPMLTYLNYSSWTPTIETKSIKDEGEEFNDMILYRLRLQKKKSKITKRNIIITPLNKVNPLPSDLKTVFSKSNENFSKMTLKSQNKV